MTLVKGQFAIVVTDPQNDFLDPKGVAWGVVGQSVTENNTVENIDNGQTTTCTNTLGMAIPAAADIVLHTDVFGEIGDLADAPVPVRVSW